MSYLVIGRRDGDTWNIDVESVGTTTAESLAGVESAARDLLRSNGYQNADEADLQLLLPDFELDLHDHAIPHDSGDGTAWAIFAGVIALFVVVGAVAFVVIQLR